MTITNMDKIMNKKTNLENTKNSIQNHLNKLVISINKLKKETNTIYTNIQASIIQYIVNTIQTYKILYILKILLILKQYSHKTSNNTQIFRSTTKILINIYI